MLSILLSPHALLGIALDIMQFLLPTDFHSKVMQREPDGWREAAPTCGSMRSCIGQAATVTEIGKEAERHSLGSKSLKRTLLGMLRRQAAKS
jgi:hypothetical protein